MTWTTEIIASIERVDPGEWDRFVGDRPFASRRWLQVTEAALTGHRPRYVLLREAGQLQACVVGCLQWRFQSRMLQSTLGGYIRRSPGLRCGVPISYNSGLFYRDPGRAQELFPRLLQGIQDLVRQERISFHTIDHLPPAAPAWEYLQAQGYHRIEHFPEIYLDTQWASFEEYLRRLPQKKRSEYRRVQGHLERAGITLQVVDRSSENEARLQQLVNNVFQRHGEPGVYQDNLFRVAGTLMGDDFKLIAAHQDGKTIGCAALLRSGNERIIKWMGLDYEQTLNTGAYYGLLAECVRQTIQSGGGRLRMGATSYQTKQHFGVTVETMIGALAFRSRPVHLLAGKVLQMAARLKTGWPITQSSTGKKAA
jgi:predicted N-acyltransferase